MEQTIESPPSEASASEAETSPAENQGHSQMWEFSKYVHLGEGAEDCKGGTNGSCADPTHFHAWCRLPNPFQNASIREKGLAAKARKTRQLRDPEADACAILDGEMAELRRAAETQEDPTKFLVEELLGQSFWRDHLRAVRELNAEEDWATIVEDQERKRVLDEMEEADRPADEFAELGRHLEKYGEALIERREAEQKPQREALSAKPVDELIVQVREARIEAEAGEDFMRVYSLWEWYIGTMKPKDPAKGFPTERVFGDVQHLQAAAPEIVERLEQVFTELEAALGSKNALGNS